MNTSKGNRVLFELENQNNSRYDVFRGLAEENGIFFNSLRITINEVKVIEISLYNETYYKSKHK